MISTPGVDISTMKADVAKATAAIISGELKVHDYMSDGQCPIVP